MIYLASDHAGFELKEVIKDYLRKKGYEVEDCGAFEFDQNDDYPDFVSKAAKEVSSNPGNKAVVIGGSGQGEAMVANKYSGVRCALFYSPPFEMIPTTRDHNDANILSLGARFLSKEDAIRAVELFLESPFKGEERHVRRIGKLKEIEEDR